MNKEQLNNEPAYRQAGKEQGIQNDERSCTLLYS